ncbi:IS1595 family transposase [Chloroflexota bacterium]
MPRPLFPKSIFEFQRQFSTEEDCLRFLIQSRWPDGFSCPKCGHGQFYWKSARKLLQCKKCGYQASVTSGTVMHRSKMPLTMWFHAAYLASTVTPGISAVQLQRQLGLSSYQTAFTMLHKLRAGMVREGRSELSGVVQVDETYVGGSKAGIRGRGALGKIIVAGAVEVKNNNMVRVRLKVIPNVSGQTLTGFVKQNVSEGSTVITDDWKGYIGLGREGYIHRVDNAGLAHIHRVFSNLKTWILGTHHGAIGKQHLQAYLNEYTFRFNRRKTPMAAFQTALGLGSQRLGPTYKGLYGVAKGTGKWTHPNPNPSRSLLDDILDCLTKGEGKG